MRALVTGVAGFIGSHLAEALLAAGHQVVGMDCFTSYYGRSAKEANLADALAHPGFDLVEADLRSAELAPLATGADVVFHQAGQPGVRLSWSDGFAAYTEHNVVATQRLLEAVKGTAVRRFVFASSSSVYGNALAYPTREGDLPRPHSPYGVTKLAAEHLCGVYAANWGVPTTALRYFTVFGPRQRPDMAMHRFIEAARRGDAVPVFGDGEQRRDFTYVDDVVAANLAAADHDVAPGTVVNVAGGCLATVNEVVAVLGRLLGSEVRVRRLPAQPGDAAVTSGSREAAARLLGWEPWVDLTTGLARQLAWHERAVTGERSDSPAR